MSAEHELIVDAADPLAEISVYDGAFKRIGRGVGRLEGRFPDGLYEVRARLGGTVQEKLISLDRDQSIRFESVAFASAIPLAGTSTADSAHQAAVARALANPKPLGSGSGLLVVVRDRPYKNSTPPPQGSSPAAGLALIAPDGSTILDVGGEAQVDRSGDAPVAAVYAEVDPGTYRLRIDRPDGGGRERALIASPGWRTQCFMMRRWIREHALADLDRGSVSIAASGSPFGPRDERVRLAEAARDALVSHRRIADAAARSLMKLKFEDPMLGLLVAHLLLRDNPGARVLATVRRNLVRLLGPAHPDVQAVNLGSSEELAAPVADMPMLRASWDRIVEHSLTRPLLVPAASPAGEAATRVLPCGPWLVWRPADVGGRADSKMAVLDSYMRNLAKSRPQATRGLIAPATLDEGARAELAQSLAVPGQVLDAMIARLRRGG
ncbi:MAG TPA: hypothetical protein VF605_10690 [Allosphingosinicella sp.]|jgi:hypothetical protein